MGDKLTRKPKYPPHGNKNLQQFTLERLDTVKSSIIRSGNKSAVAWNTVRKEAGQSSTFSLTRQKAEKTPNDPSSNSCSKKRAQRNLI
jgi:hypothetical protein